MAIEDCYIALQLLLRINWKVTIHATQTKSTILALSCNSREIPLTASHKSFKCHRATLPEMLCIHEGASWHHIFCLMHHDITYSVWCIMISHILSGASWYHWFCLVHRDITYSVWLGLENITVVNRNVCVYESQFTPCIRAWDKFTVFIQSSWILWVQHFGPIQVIVQFQYVEPCIKDNAVWPSQNFSKGEYRRENSERHISFLKSLRMSWKFPPPPPKQ